MTKQEMIFKERFENACFDYACQKNPGTTKEFVVSTVSKLHRISTTLQRLYTDCCNNGRSEELDKRISNLEFKSAAYSLSLGFKKLEINSDPRGCPFEFIAYDGKRYRFGW